MSKSVSILIVEDELLIAQDLKEILEEVGYTNVCTARDYVTAKENLIQHNFDLVLLDINLGSNKSGIDLGAEINQENLFPFIYTTSNPDVITLNKVKLTNPSGFLIKPYSKAQLLASIEIGLSNFSQSKSTTENTNNELLLNQNKLIIGDFLLIKENYCFTKVSLLSVMWFTSDKNYIEVKTEERKYIIRSSLKNLLNQLPKTNFVKCGKQYIINTQHVNHFNNQTLNINGQNISISRNTRQQVLSKLKQ